ncbi:bifunctional Delta(1)-pyrroline-2-carboxylate/Delta(1)-piperideine-2-carboxylate reductase [Undibacterium oligocarboniphilum]|uniref:Ornithine cyclodeaminase family protein n=1 Tax=Undibacterium oligocarboniphilum TaxID=666702 RepID=A0A850QI34_9BURK|nr:ornithine cyclodeaminase family protein [Undibacterium oligocarboniphilum]MBC3869125.1 ornithine cyclodeaminase family protein [Undibacterium oligocarboniphilum]NVO77105.1 ornithine cyclodeaminase family protein [Undibacterium oligocarboniphilum]
MIPYFDRQQIRQALPYQELISALAEQFCQPIQAPQRHVHTISEQPISTLLLMPVWQEGGKAGVKLVTVAPENTAAPSVHAIFILLDARTGVPLALMDGEELTLRRTAAASALASSYLSRPDSRTLLMVGTGTLIPALAAAHTVTRVFRQVQVWGRDEKKAHQCAMNIRNNPDFPSDVEVIVATDLANAAGQADVISCATTSRAPIIQGNWLKPGTHLDLVGGFRPDMREVDDTAVGRSRIAVDTYSGALSEAGDLTQPMKNGIIGRGNILAELSELCAGKKIPTSIPGLDITLFKSVGTAIEDLCAAELVWNQCPAQQTE